MPFDPAPLAARARRFVERLRHRRWSFRDGVLLGISTVGVVVLAVVLATSGSGESFRAVASGTPGPVSGLSRDALPPNTLSTPATGAQPEASSTGATTSGRPTASSAGSDDDDDQEATAPVTDPERASALPDQRAVSCPQASTRVASAEELQDALAGARPGTVIELTDATYPGTFVASTSGTAEAPIWLCGGRGAVLDGGGTGKGYGFHLYGAQHWRLVGFTVRNAQKGVVADGTSGTVIQDLLVEGIGDEAIHLRSQSTGNAILRNTIRTTGLRRVKFGEGIYIGSAKSNWSKYSAGRPDRSDFNLVAENDIAGTAAESVDIKEGTTGGALRGNIFDGSGMTGGDSWVDVKGNGWLIQGNTGRNTPKDGMQTHRILDGWGADNVFDANVIDVPAPGLGIYIHDADQTGNRVHCNNRTSTGDPVTSSLECSDQ